MTEMFGEAWSPMSVPDLAPDDDEWIPDRPFLPICLRLVCFPSRSKYNQL